MDPMLDTIDRLNELKGALDKHIAVSAEIERKIDQMFVTLIVGNGVPSIKERVNRLEQNMLDKATVKELEGKIERLESVMPDPKEWSEIRSWTFWNKWIIGVVTVAVIGQIVAMIFRLLPGL